MTTYDMAPPPIASDALRIISENYLLGKFRNRSELKNSQSDDKTGEIDMIQVLFDNSSELLKMYGSPEEFMDNLKIYRNFTTSYKYFETKHANLHYTIPIVYTSLKGGIFMAKADFYVMLENIALRNLHPKPNSNFHEVGVYCAFLTHFLKIKAKSVNRKIEFVRFNEKEIDDIENEFVKGIDLSDGPCSTDISFHGRKSPGGTIKQFAKKMREYLPGVTDDDILFQCLQSANCSFDKDFNKPNGQFVLENDREKILEFLAELPIRKVGGIGRVSEAHLQSMEIRTVGDMLLKKALFPLCFSPLAQESFLRTALGLPGRPSSSDPRRKSISVERTFSPTSDFKILVAEHAEICQMLEEDIRKSGVTGGKTITLKLKLSSFDVLTRSLTPSEVVTSLEDILKYSLELLERERGKEIRLLGVDAQCASIGTSLDVDPKTTEYLSKFFASTGVPFDAIHSSPFRELVRHLNPNCALPEEDSMFKYVEKQNSLTKPLVNFQKTVGPLGVTIDVAGNDDEKYLVFSIHYFDDLYERKNIVYLRKLLLSELDAESLLISIRRAISISYSSVKFSSIVCPNDQIYNLVASSGVIKRYHICFYNYMSMFIAELMKIDEFSDGLASLREFVRFVKRDAELYSKFRRMQLSKNAELDLPLIDDGSWENTCVFLTRCLVLHDTLTEYCERFQQTTYINNSTFNHLIYLQRLMQQCLKYCRELSSPNNTISQILPAVEGLRQYIHTHDMGYRFQKTIKDSLNNCFGYLNQTHIRSRYEMATLMDPRYAYHDIFSPLKCKQIESRVAEEFVKTDAGAEKSFFEDISQMTSDERREIIMKEFVHYRQVSFVERPEESDSPFYWWGSRQMHMEHLLVLAREIVATPATSIDASHFFSSGGKFQHLCKKYSYARLDDCLSVAGINQHFRGRGATAEIMTQSMQESLNSTAKRLQKQTHFGLYTHGSDFNTDRRREEIIGQGYPSPPTMAMNRDGYEMEEKPQHLLPAPLQMAQSMQETLNSTAKRIQMQTKFASLRPADLRAFIAKEAEKRGIFYEDSDDSTSSDDENSPQQDFVIKKTQRPADLRAFIAKEAEKRGIIYEESDDSTSSDEDPDYSPETSTSSYKRRAESPSASDDVDSGEPPVRKSLRQSSRRYVEKKNTYTIW